MFADPRSCLGLRCRQSTTLMREQHARREFTSLPVLLPLVWAVLGANYGAGAAPAPPVRVCSAFRASTATRLLRVQAPSASLAYDMVIVMRAAGSLR